MTLVLIRHGAAVPAGPGRRNAARGLTDRGRRRFVRSVRGLRRLGFRFDVALHSPWRRATESADLLAPCVRGVFRVSAGLARRPGPDLLDELRGETVAVVGHEPWLHELAAILVTGTADHADRIRLGRGGAAVLEGTPAAGGMRLVAVYPPRALRRIARPKS